MTSYLGSWHSNISFLELFGRNTKGEDSAKGCTPQLHHTQASHTHIPPPPPTHRQTRTPWPIKKGFPDQEALLYGTWAGTPKGAAHTHWVGEQPGLQFVGLWGQFYLILSSHLKPQAACQEPGLMRPSSSSSFSQVSPRQAKAAPGVSSKELMQTSWPRVSHPELQRKGEGLQVPGASERTWEVWQGPSPGGRWAVPHFAVPD